MSKYDDSINCFKLREDVGQFALLFSHWCF